MMKQLFLFAFILIILTACEINYEQLSQVDTIERDIPLIVMDNVRYDEMSGNELSQRVTAETFKVFENPGYVEIYKGDVITYQSDGSVELEGEAGFGRYDRESEDAEVREDISMRFHPEEISVSAKEFLWEDQDRVLRSPESEVVEIIRGDGSIIKGKGFNVDMKTKTVSFQNASEGRLNTDDVSNEESGLENDASE